MDLASHLMNPVRQQWRQANQNKPVALSLGLGSEPVEYHTKLQHKEEARVEHHLQKQQLAQVLAQRANPQHFRFEDFEGPSSSQHDGHVYLCEFGCGFSGSYDAVEAHENTCQMDEHQQPTDGIAELLTEQWLDSRSNTPISHAKGAEQQGSRSTEAARSSRDGSNSYGNSSSALKRPPPLPSHPPPQASAYPSPRPPPNSPRSAPVPPASKTLSRQPSPLVSRTVAAHKPSLEELEVIPLKRPPLTLHHTTPPPAKRSQVDKNDGSGGYQELRPGQANKDYLCFRLFPQVRNSTSDSVIVKIHQTSSWHDVLRSCTTTLESTFPVRRLFFTDGRPMYSIEDLNGAHSVVSTFGQPFTVTPQGVQRPKNQSNGRARHITAGRRARKVKVKVKLEQTPALGYILKSTHKLKGKAKSKTKNRNKSKRKFRGKSKRKKRGQHQLPKLVTGGMEEATERTREVQLDTGSLVIDTTKLAVGAIESSEKHEIEPGEKDEIETDDKDEIEQDRKDFEQEWRRQQQVLKGRDQNTTANLHSNHLIELLAPSPRPVSRRTGSRCSSRGASRLGSRSGSRLGSRSGSRLGSRSGSRLGSRSGSRGASSFAKSLHRDVIFNSHPLGFSVGVMVSFLDETASSACTCRVTRSSLPDQVPIGWQVVKIGAIDTSRPGFDTPAIHALLHSQNMPLTVRFAPAESYIPSPLQYTYTQPQSPRRSVKFIAPSPKTESRGIDSEIDQTSVVGTPHESISSKWISENSPNENPPPGAQTTTFKEFTSVRSTDVETTETGKDKQEIDANFLPQKVEQVRHATTAVSTPASAVLSPAKLLDGDTDADDDVGTHAGSGTEAGTGAGTESGELNSGSGGNNSGASMLTHQIISASQKPTTQQKTLAIQRNRDARSDLVARAHAKRVKEEPKQKQSTPCQVASPVVALGVEVSLVQQKRQLEQIAMRYYRPEPKVENEVPKASSKSGNVDATEREGRDQDQDQDQDVQERGGGGSRDADECDGQLIEQHRLKEEEFRRQEEECQKKLLREQPRLEEEKVRKEEEEFQKQQKQKQLNEKQREEKERKRKLSKEMEDKVDQLLHGTETAEANADLAVSDFLHTMWDTMVQETEQADLETWLREKAELSGDKLIASISACKQGLVDCIKDLLQLYEMDKLGLAFPQAMLRAKVEIALDREKDNIKAQDSTTNEKETPKLSTVPSLSAILQTQQQAQSCTKNSLEKR